MNLYHITKYYSNPKVQQEMLKIAKNREVVGSFRDGSFFHRPDTMEYPKDIEERVKKGITCFHCSVEHWKSPMQLSSQLRGKELDELRSGYDIIIDIDSKAKLEHASITARIIYEKLKDLGVKATLKFSGSRGFHVGIASNAIPKRINFKPTSDQYPEIPQMIALYLREELKEQILEELINYEGGVAALVQTVPEVSELSPFQFVDVEKNWGNRHLFRMPYSLHPKYWLVSLPIKAEQLKDFKSKIAEPDKVDFKAKFLVNKDGEAMELFEKALKWKKTVKKKDIPVRKFKKGSPIPEEFFPPCMQKILQGLSDGRKRSLFTVAAFLRAVNWPNEEIEKRVREWNKNNKPPLTERTINTQLKWHFRQNRDLMPANNDSDMFYKSIGIEHVPECQKNPVNYAYKKFFEKKRIKKTKK